ncbi:MAG: 2-oxoglutarate ferredoxin oxidoreductase subunit delta [Bacillota bacterium]|nr:MAG: 2-oxoglutarate ferredoxin oxidoreductase subunit delta [Bacillota bacterium]
MTVHIDTPLCKGCALCARYCPRDVLVMTEVTNRKGFNVVGVINPENCINCRLCEMYCPDLAIAIEVPAKK